MYPLGRYRRSINSALASRHSLQDRTAGSSQFASHITFTVYEALQFLKNDNVYAKKVLEAEFEAKQQMATTIQALITVVQRIFYLSDFFVS